MKQKVLLLLIFLLLASVSNANALYSGGDGSEGTPWEIRTCVELQDMNAHLNDLSVYFELKNNIDCYDTINWTAQATGVLGFTPVGTVGVEFEGHFDGNGYIISGLTAITSNGSLISGLFGNTDHANIKNVGLVDFTIRTTGGNSSAGALMGKSGDGGDVNSVFVQNSIIEGTYFVGAIVGQSYTDLNQVYAINTQVIGPSNAGGIVGWQQLANSGSTWHAYSTASISSLEATNGGMGGKGTQTSDGPFTESYWNITDSNTADNSLGTVITQAQQRKEASYVNWNFDDTWFINEDMNTPFLRIFEDFYLPLIFIPKNDLNITTINGISMLTHPGFVYGLDGNITIDFNVYDNNNGRMTIDLNYSQTVTQGTGTVIVKDLNLTSTYCPDQNFLRVSECSYTWNYSELVDGNYTIIGLIKDGNINDFNAGDGNFQIINDVNLLIQIPIDESTGDPINTSTYSFIVKILNAGFETTYSNQTDANRFVIPISTNITILIDTNVDAYYWGREYQLLYETPTPFDTLQPYLAPLGSSVLTTIHTVSMATLTAIPDMTIKVYKDLVGGKTLINNSLTDGKGETAVAFVIADNYEIEVWDGNELLYSENYVATATTNNHYIYLPLGGGVEYPVIPNISVRYLPALRERTSTDFNVQIIIASNNGSISSARVNLFNNGVNLFDTGLDTLISSDGNTYIINVNDLAGLDTAYPLDANVTVWLIDGTTITSREDSWRFGFVGAEEDSMMWLLTNGMRKDFGCSYGTDALLGTTCQPLFLISIFIIFFAIGGLALNQFRNGTALAIMAIIMTSFFVYITWIPFVWGVLMAVAGIVIIITTSRVGM